MQTVTKVVPVAGSFLAAVIGLGIEVRSTVAGVVPPVEFRIVERTGQTQASPSDGILNFAVQARVNGLGHISGLGAFSLALTITGENESRGTLSRDRTTEVDGTYTSGISGPASGVSSGLPRQYGYYAGLNPNFNGLINASGSIWTQTSSQDIGLITGAALGSGLLGAPGVDVDEDGNPDTTVFGSGQPHATLPASVMRDYFGADTWIDVYRFRYTLNNFTPRNLQLSMSGDGVAHTPTYRIFEQTIFNLGLWGADWPAAGNVVPAGLQGLTIGVIPAPGSVLALLPIAAITSRRRR